MDVDNFRQWSNAIAPYVAIAATIWVAVRVQHVKYLVNSEMTKFRETLIGELEAAKASLFAAGQQDIRDKNRTTVTAAAHATEAAAVATTAAANAVKSGK